MPICFELIGVLAVSNEKVLLSKTLPSASLSEASTFGFLHFEIIEIGMFKVLSISLVSIFV
jgi:hypothetical protein